MVIVDYRRRGIWWGLSGGFTTAKKGPLIADIPLEYIRRPLLRTRNNDPEKVKQLMESIAEIGLQEPVSYTTNRTNSRKLGIIKDADTAFRPLGSRLGKSVFEPQSCQLDHVRCVCQVCHS